MLNRFLPYAIGVSIMVAIVGGSMLLLKGVLWASDNLLPPLIKVGWWILGATVVIALPLSISKKMRGGVAVAIMLSSFVYGLIAWLTAIVITYTYWGIVGVIMGLFLAIVGIVPVGLLASAFHGWDGFVPLVVLVALSFGSQIVAVMLAASAATEA